MRFFDKDQAGICGTTASNHSGTATACGVPSCRRGGHFDSDRERTRRRAIGLWLCIGKRARNGASVFPRDAIS